MTCPHCGSPHPAGTAFCPMTGRPIESGALVASSPRGAGALLAEAFQLYRGHAKAFLAAAAIALVPIYLIHAGLAAALLPSRAYTADVEARAERIQRRSEELQRRMQSGTLTAEEAARAEQEMARDLGAALAETGSALAGAGLFLLSMALLIPLSVLGTFFGTAALIPLVEDRAQGGSLTPGEAWGQVGKRAVPLVLTAVLAAAAVLVGLFLLVVPGVVLGFLFAFAAPIVMIEGTSGLAALKRSARLVMSNWLPTAIVLLALALLSAVASWIGGLFVPERFPFLHTLVQDALSLVVFPLPVIGLVLLFREVRAGAPAAAGYSQPLPAH